MKKTNRKRLRIRWSIKTKEVEYTSQNAKMNSVKLLKLIAVNVFHLAQDCASSSAPANRGSKSDNGKDTSLADVKSK